MLASRGGDSMPAVLIEAGLMEIPAIATPIEAIPEIVVPEVTGKLVPVGDVDGLARAMRALAADPDLVRTLGRSARAHCAARYAIEPISVAWEAVLRQVADEPAEHRGYAEPDTLATAAPNGAESSSSAKRMSHVAVRDERRGRRRPSRVRSCGIVAEQSQLGGEVVRVTGLVEECVHAVVDEAGDLADARRDARPAHRPGTRAA